MPLIGSLRLCSCLILIFAFARSEPAGSRRITASRAIYIAIAWLLRRTGHSLAVCGAKSWIFSFIILQSSSQLSSLTLGTVINLSDWLRAGAGSRSSPGAPSILPWRETKTFRTLRLELSRGPKRARGRQSGKPSARWNRSAIQHLLQPKQSSAKKNLQHSS